MYNQYKGVKDYDHGEVPAVGVLLVNLGTPDAPTKKALKPYLRDFLGDPRVIEVNPWIWKVILNLFILPFRPKKSAALYKSIWWEDGSPLLKISEQQRDKLRARLEQDMGTPVRVELAMRIGNPSLESVMDKMRDEGVRKLLVVPMFPQYSGTTTASAFDGVADELKQWRWIPEFRMITSYHDHPRYIEALAEKVEALWSKEGKPQKLIMSFHGVPKRYLLNGDPYHCHCHKTGRLLAERLGLESNEYMVTFQSLFGKEEWLRPYTDETLGSLPEKGIKKVDVICPAFTADCLETLEEIEEENRDEFMDAGGEQYRYIPCVNDSDTFIDCLYDLVQSHAHGWLSLKDDWNDSAAHDSAEESLARYRSLVA